MWRTAEPLARHHVVATVQRSFEVLQPVRTTPNFRVPTLRTAACSPSGFYPTACASCYQQGRVPSNRPAARESASCNGALCRRCAGTGAALLVLGLVDAQSTTRTICGKIATDHHKCQRHGAVNNCAFVRLCVFGTGVRGAVMSNRVGMLPCLVSVFTCQCGRRCGERSATQTDHTNYNGKKKTTNERRPNCMGER